MRDLEGLRQRQLDANARINAAIDRLVLQVDGLEAWRPMVQKVVNTEGSLQKVTSSEELAVFLEGFVDKLPTYQSVQDALLARIESLPGIGRKTIELIREGL